MNTLDESARTMLDELGLDTEIGDDSVAFVPSVGNRACEALFEAAPEVGSDVDATAAKIHTPFWSRQTVRNSLAWMLVGLAATAHVVGRLCLILGVGGVSATGAYSVVSDRKRDAGSRPNTTAQEQ